MSRDPEDQSQRGGGTCPLSPGSELGPGDGNEGETDSGSRQEESPAAGARNGITRSQADTV